MKRILIIAVLMLTPQPSWAQQPEQRVPVTVMAGSGSWSKPDGKAPTRPVKVHASWWKIWRHIPGVR
jgi:hypothetical protein